MSVYLGVDWGTHSSKWAFQHPGLNPIVGTIWDSAVSRIRGLPLRCCSQVPHIRSRCEVRIRSARHDPLDEHHGCANVSGMSLAEWNSAR